VRQSLHSFLLAAEFDIVSRFVISLSATTSLNVVPAAALLIGLVGIETLVLAFNSWQCPLTSMAARYTVERRANFDIYLPEWLARHNKFVFGALYVAGILFTLVRWARA
jgi:polyferredoxin